MSHKRKEIRYAFKSLLEGKTRALFRIWCSRSRPIFDHETPAVLIWSGDETIEKFNEAPIRYKRTLEINIECYVDSVDEIDDDVDLIMAQVEKAIEDADLFTLARTVDTIEPLGSSVELRGETSREGAVGTLRYAVVYYTSAGVSPNNFPPALGIDAEWDKEVFTRDTIDFDQT